jgi:hypothetical protein
VELENNNISVDTEEEYFRKSYALELQKKKQQINDYQSLSISKVKSQSLIVQ